MARLDFNPDRATAQMRAAAGDGLYEAAEFGLQESNKTVPFDEGELERSGNVSIDRAALIAHISYDEPYAARQHEELDWRHKPGRRAKWLELTMQEQADRIRDHIASKLREAL